MTALLIALTVLVAVVVSILVARDVRRADEAWDAWHAARMKDLRRLLNQQQHRSTTGEVD